MNIETINNNEYILLISTINNDFESGSWNMRIERNMPVFENKDLDWQIKWDTDNRNWRVFDNDGLPLCLVRFDDDDYPLYCFMN